MKRGLRNPYLQEADMKTIEPRLIAAGLLFLFTLISGFWLSKSGKPINVTIFTIHKLIALLTAILIAAAIVHLHQAIDTRTIFEFGAAKFSAAKFSAVLFGAIAATGLLFLLLFISGALLSLEKPVPGVFLTIHQAAPLVAGISAAVTIYLLANGNS
jgi:hypothetical protein